MSNQSCFPSEDHRKLLLTTLKLHGIEHVEGMFSGSGDSGSVDDIHFYNKDWQSVDGRNIFLPWPQDEGSMFVDGQGWVKKRSETEEQRSLYDIVEQLTYDAAELSDVDWVNNDGGEGKLTIDFEGTTPTVQLSIAQRVLDWQTMEF